MDNTIYTQSYYAKCLGVDYSDKEVWTPVFEKIADRIIEDFHPKTTLDVGCAWGYLVAALRDRGVRAYGVDISEYAIKNVREDIRQFCFAASITEPLPESLPQNYDLVTCIEVLEHMDEAEGAIAVKNLCGCSDKIIFTSSPDDITEQTHYNVQQIEYWSKRFAQNGFTRSLAYIPDYIAPHGVFFQKADISIPNLVDAYERQLRITNANLNLARNSCASLQNELNLREQSLFSQDEHEVVLYLDDGSGFTEDAILKKTCKSEGQRLNLNVSFGIPSGIQKIRFDPANSSCVIKDLRITSDKGVLSYSANGYKFEEYYVFLSSDPQVHISYEDNISWIVVSARIYKYDTTIFMDIFTRAKISIDESKNALESTLAQYASLQSELDTKKEELANAKKEITNTLEEFLALKLRLGSNEGLLAETQKNLAKSEDNAAALQDEISSVSLKLDLANGELASCHDALKAVERLGNKETTELRDTQTVLENNLQQARQELNATQVALSSAQGMVDTFTRSTFWRMTKPLRVVCDFIKSLLRSKPKTKPEPDTSPAPALAPEAIDPDPATSKYAEWIALYDTIDDEKRIAIKKAIKKMNSGSPLPLISVVMPVYNPPVHILREAIDSVMKQLYPYWELCIADDASPNPEIRDILSQYAAKDKRVKVHFRDENGHISEASNSALSLALGEFVALLDHDDVLPENALYEVARAIKENPVACLFYSDEDKLDFQSRRRDPYFKPDWNPDLFLSHNLFTHLGVYKRNLLLEIGGFRVGFEGAQDYDLVLRCIEVVGHSAVCHIPKILYHWRMTLESTAAGPDKKPYAIHAAVQAISESLEHQNIMATVTEFMPGRGLIRVKYKLPDVLPKVSIIILTRDKLEFLEKCINSIQSKTIYSNYEIIIVDNGSVEEETSEYLKNISQKPNVKVLRDDGLFNYSRLNNIAVDACNGEIVCLLNNDIEVITSDWLGEMVSHAVRPGIGAVGSRLWYPNDTLQHGGVMLGVVGVAIHIHHAITRDNPGYFGRAWLIQNFSAVTGACMMIKKSIYQELGGLDEKNLSVACNDVDFCIRVRDAGYRNLWTPFAELYHHESASRGYEITLEKQERFRKETEYMKKTHGDKLLKDPAYNPNLSLTDSFALAFPPRFYR
ncbi:hypothetical protein AGMMS50276_26030 [Synergistales bacterium]|nr:hypothetical protein AGMMS50276_26030 [Synergistales bacterium]